TPMGSRITALRAVSRTAAMSTRPDYADFDVVTIDPTEDAEAVARAFSSRADVEYAQTVNRVDALFKPNDRFYPEQWNLPLIDMERAWDIQPSAGSSIIVAVVDTGIAFLDKVLRFHASAFRDDQGNVY